MGNWWRHSREFKQQVVEKMKTSDNIHELARELKLDQFEGRPEKNHADYRENPDPETVEVRLRRENKELKEALGQKAAEVDFLIAALRRVKRDGQGNGENGAAASKPKSESNKAN